MRYVAVAVALAVVALGATAVSLAQHGGIEFNVVLVQVPNELLGSLQTYLVPLNVSSAKLLSTSNVYVVVQGIPRLSYLFSVNPPLVAFLEDSAYAATYEVWYGGGNPYPQLVAYPNTDQSFWLAFDDFDYATGYWAMVNTSVAGSKCYVNPGGYLALTTAYSPRTAHVWLLHGRRALVVSLPEPYRGFVALTLTQSNFTDIRYVVDGSDVFAVDRYGRCLRYAVLLLDKERWVLTVAVDPEGETTVYLLYGGANACPEYRVG